MRSGLISLVLLAVLLATPAAAEVVVDFSWLSFTGTEIDNQGTAVGGQISGRDPAARWDAASGTFRFVHDGQTFGGTFLKFSESLWNQVIDVPTHPAFRAATGHPASTLIILEETPTGLTALGRHGSMFEMVQFSGTATRRAVTAFEPGTTAILVAFGLAAAARARRRA